MEGRGEGAAQDGPTYDNKGDFEGRIDATQLEGCWVGTGCLIIPICESLAPEGPNEFTKSGC